MAFDPISPLKLTFAHAGAAGVAPGGCHADLPHAAALLLRARRRRGGGGGGIVGRGGGDVRVWVEYDGRGVAVDAEVLLDQDLQQEQREKIIYRVVHQ